MNGDEKRFVKAIVSLLVVVVALVISVYVFIVKLVLEPLIAVYKSEGYSGAVIYMLSIICVILLILLISEGRKRY